MNKKTLSNADLQLFAEMLMKINKSSMRTCQREAITALAAYRNKLCTKNGFLFKICCGGGKTLIEAFFILKEILKAEAEGRKARICIASHRLLLNNQLLQNVYAILAAYEIKVWYYSASSAGTAKIDDDKEIQLRKFTKDLFKLDEDGERMLDVINKHIIVIACAKTENALFKDYDEDFTTIANISETNSSTPIFDLLVQDEAHKECSKKLIESLMKISKFALFFTATPNRILEKNFSCQIYSFNFKRALELSYVVKGTLYIAQRKKAKMSDAKRQSSYIEYAFKHLISHSTQNQILLNYLPSVDNMPKIAETLHKAFPDANIVTFASPKIVKNKKNGMETNDGYTVECKFNDESLKKEDMLERLRRVDRPTIILSAFMIVEGIDLPSVNGVGIWCDKNDQNLFQAACRGCRTAPGKTGYNIYVSEELSDCKDFLYKLYNGFDGELDFGDGQEDCTGTGSSGKNTADDNTVRIVPAAAVNTVMVKFDEVKIESEEEINELAAENKIENAITNAVTLGEAVHILAELCGSDRSMSDKMVVDYIKVLEERY